MSTEFVRFVTDDGDELYLKPASILGAHYAPKDAEDAESVAGITVREANPDGSFEEHDFAGEAAEKVRSWFAAASAPSPIPKWRPSRRGSPLETSVRARLIELLKAWPGHAEINWATTIDNAAVALLLDVLPPTAYLVQTYRLDIPIDRREEA